MKKNFETPEVEITEFEVIIQTDNVSNPDMSEDGWV